MDTTIFEHEEDMRYAAEFALNSEELSSTAAGICKLILDKGWSHLSSSQKTTFERYALPYAQLECELCGTEIPFSELSISDGRYCGWCYHQMEKIDEE